MPGLTEPRRGGAAWWRIGALLTLSSSALTAERATRELALTIYNDDTALVQDHRRIELAGGRQRLEFEDVSARIRPETASLAAEDLSVIEQNFDFDLLTPAKLMEKAVGHTVTLVRVNPSNGAETRESAQVLATNGGVVLRIGDRIEVLRDDGLPVRVIFDKVPDNLRAHPTLSVTVETAHAGARAATLTYLTPGLAWHADYVALYHQAEHTLDVQGWVTLTNASGTTYENARTLLVAGAPARVGEDATPPFAPSARSNVMAVGTQSGSRTRVGDFYLYPLAERTTVADQQTKQVGFFDVHGVPAEHGYEFRNAWLASSNDPLSAQTVYRFSTGSHAGLGDQLPAGVLRFYLRDQQGAPQFVGESRIDHTPMGTMLSLATGDAFDVKVQPTVEQRTQDGQHRWRTAMRYTLSNASDEPVKVTVVQGGLWGDTSVLAQSQPGTRTRADEIQWLVPVPAHGKSELTASFNTRF